MFYTSHFYKISINDISLSWLFLEVKSSDFSKILSQTKVDITFYKISQYLHILVESKFKGFQIMKLNLSQFLLSCYMTVQNNRVNCIFVLHHEPIVVRVSFFLHCLPPTKPRFSIIYRFVPSHKFLDFMEVERFSALP